MDNFNLRNMQLAYTAVYDQNLCESMEELGLIGEGSSGQDQFKLWVNDLLDEGYDLSGYTWDELYEGYKELPRRKMLNKSNKLRKSGDVNKKARAADIEYQMRAHSPEASKTLSYLNTRKEEYDAFDVVLEYLLDEESAHNAYERLARKRNKKGRTSGGDLAARHARRSDPRPSSSDQDRKRRSMTQSDRDEYRADSEDADEPSGPGGMPKGKKLARQRARGVSAESYDAFDVVLEYLLDEGFAETVEGAEAIMVNMSEGWIETILVEKEGYGDAAIDKDPLSKYRPDSEARKYLKKNPYNVNRRFFPKSGELSRGSRTSSDVMDTLKKMEGKSKPTRKLPDPDRSNRAPKPRVLPNPKR
jgi:hypothetical protein